MKWKSKINRIALAFLANNMQQKKEEITKFNFTTTTYPLLVLVLKCIITLWYDMINSSKWTDSGEECSASPPQLLACTHYFDQRLFLQIHKFRILAVIDKWSGKKREREEREEGRRGRKERIKRNNNFCILEIMQEMKWVSSYKWKRREREGEGEREGR